MDSIALSTQPAPTERRRFYQGRIVVTPLPDSLPNGNNNINKASQQQIDPGTLKLKSGPLHIQPESHSVYNLFHHPDTISTTQKSVLEDGPCSSLKLDIYIYNNHGGDFSAQSSTHLELNRRSSEQISDTLQRIVLNLTKKLLGIGHQKQRRLPGDLCTLPSSGPAPMVWTVESEARQHSPLQTLASELDVSERANVEFWTEARKSTLAVTISLPPSAEGEETTRLCLMVESCSPTVTSVRTFEEFQAFLFVGVPLVVQIDTLYATRCRVDWYVGGSLHQTTWDAHCLTPVESQVDMEVTLLITPDRVEDDRLLPHNGMGCEQAYQFKKRIEPLPENTLQRIRTEWLADSTHRGAGHEANAVRVLSYNILANQNAFQANRMPVYPYVSKEILSKDRRMPLVLQEILAYGADVVCLQEVDESVFHGLFEPVLTSRQFNYQGMYSVKTNEGTREGCALFWSMDKFLPLPEKDRKSFAIHEILARDDRDEHDDWQQSTRILSELLESRRDLREMFTTNLGHVVQMVPLTIRPSDEPASEGCNVAPPIWIVNTHLFFHPLASHIRLLQMLMLARQLGYELHRRPGDVIFCGDFNSSMQNSAGKLVLERSVPANFRDNKRHLNSFRWEKAAATDQSEVTDDDFPCFALPDSFPALRSAVEPTPEFTHYIGGFQGTLDHILISNKIRCLRSAPMPSVGDVIVATAMPSANLPSDHVSLVCDLIIKASD